MIIIKALTNYLTHLPKSSSTDIVVAYSGGVDSHVLLHGLSLLREKFIFTLHAVHIHHGLSANADQWQSHCRGECASLQVPFRTANVTLQNTSRTSLEALAREARYKKIVELVPDNSTVLLAQHQDDQLETFLLQLKRGAGPKGLSGMTQSWKMTDQLNSKQVNCYRPLLGIKRQAILDYAVEHNLRWCEDESNENTDFDRNFLRHDVLPIMQQRWPELAKSVSRSAHLCAQQQMLLDEICAEKLSDLQQPDKSLSVEGLMQLSEQWLTAVVRYWLAEQGISSPSFSVIQQLKSQVLEAVEDATPILQWQNWQFRRFNQQLYVCLVQEKIAPFCVSWLGEKILQLPSDLGQLQFTVTNEELNELPSFNPEQGNLTIKVGGYSQRFTPKNSLHSKPLKQWFKQWKIAPWKREACLQLLQNDKIFAVCVSGKWVVSEKQQEEGNAGVSVQFFRSHLK